MTNAALPCPKIASLTHATATEKSIYAKFAYPCKGRGGWETLSHQYLAMKDECNERGLRACSFTHFREILRRGNNVRFPNRCSHPYGYGAMAISQHAKLDLRSLAAGWRWASKTSSD